MTIEMALPAGTTLAAPAPTGSLRVIRALGSDGVFLVYEAEESAGGTRRSLRELMPADLATRRGLEVIARKDRSPELLAEAKRLVREEAATSQRLGHPSLLPRRLMTGHHQDLERTLNDGSQLSVRDYVGHF